MTPKEMKRNRKLEELQTRHRELLSERIPIIAEFKQKSKALDKVRRELNKKSAEIRDVGEQIFHLKHDGETPHVTDHALVRYLERVAGLDVWGLKAIVAEHKNAVYDGNVVVTVNQELEPAVPDSIKGTGFYTPMDLAPGEVR